MQAHRVGGQRRGIGRCSLLLWAGVLLASTSARGQLPPDFPFEPSAPHAAVAGDGRVALAFAADAAVWSVLSPDGGSSWGAPVRVGSHGKLEWGITRGPRIAWSGDQLVIAAVHGEQLRGRDGDVYAWRSVDGGETWGQPLRINDVEGAAREGLQALAAGTEGRLFCTWLDMRGEGTELWGAWSTDGGASWGQDVLVYRSPGDSICECCHVTASFGPDGRTVTVVFRNARDGNRDIHEVSGRRDGRGWYSSRLDAVPWPLEGCPMAGGELAVRANGDSLHVWRRERDLVARWNRGPQFVFARGGRFPRVAARADDFALLWATADGELVQAWIRSQADLESLAQHAHSAAPAPSHDRVTVLGAGHNPWLAAAPFFSADSASRETNGGPLLAVFETSEEGVGRMAVRILSRRTP